jgi:hypothetical protein
LYNIRNLEAHFIPFLPQGLSSLSLDQYSKRSELPISVFTQLPTKLEELCIYDCEFIGDSFFKYLPKSLKR